MGLSMGDRLHTTRLADIVKKAERLRADPQRRLIFNQPYQIIFDYRHNSLKDDQNDGQLTVPSAKG